MKSKFMRELTNQEAKVLRLVALTGASTEALAKMLGCTERTVKYHVANLHEALGVDSRIELNALVLRTVVQRLAEIEGVKWPKNKNAQVKATREFLRVLFDGDQDPIALAFLEEPSPGEFKQKSSKDAESRRQKHRPRGPYDWNSVDWSLPKAEIAKKLGCSRAMVYRKYNELFKSGARPKTSRRRT